MAIKLPQASTLAGGLTGLAAWGIALLLNSHGIPVSQDQILAVITTLVPLIVHITPDGIQKEITIIDGKIKIIASVMPQTYSAPTDFPQASPQDKGTATPNNINKA